MTDTQSSWKTEQLNPSGEIRYSRPPNSDAEFASIARHTATAAYASDRDTSNGRSIASMVLGILAVIPLSWLYILPALVMGILAVVFATSERKAGNDNGMAKAGFVMGIVSVCLAAAVAVFVAIAVAIAASQP